MKNNKAMTYVLLALVIGIWGYVVYTILVKVSGDDGNMPTLAVRPVVESDLSYYRWKDSLEYDTLYHSPFSAEDQLVELVTEEPVSDGEYQVYQEPYDPLAYAPAMDVQYLGYIENESQKQRIALIQINGRQYYMHPKEQIDGVTLVNVNPTDIEIKTDYQTLTITKQ
ncbi:hypothetical protein [Sphingobacterium haloxyli]|uniref:Uncharacterized protein n=1 Tax=Sphingobacterium haloxyli TaxID=2100533 RepID=A0A2S9J0G4_9SPHI|nr:hypothetical protein [Sphingobacterium haloxyli]PRD46265.1 hypothetical protein C5745_15875 [Sphingobacterium haloxyli]